MSDTKSDARQGSAAGWTLLGAWAVRSVHAQLPSGSGKLECVAAAGEEDDAALAGAVACAQGDQAAEVLAVDDHQQPGDLVGNGDAGLVE